MKHWIQKVSRNRRNNKIPWIWQYGPDQKCHVIQWGPEGSDKKMLPSFYANMCWYTFSQILQLRFWRVLRDIRVKQVVINKFAWWLGNYLDTPWKLLSGDRMSCQRCQASPDRQPNPDIFPTLTLSLSAWLRFALTPRTNTDCDIDPAWEKWLDTHMHMEGRREIRSRMLRAGSLDLAP